MKNILIGNFDSLKTAGCILCQSDSQRPIFQYVMMAMASNPCPECVSFRKGACECYQRFHSAAIQRRKLTEQVAQTRAARPIIVKCECGLRVRGNDEAHRNSPQHARAIQKLATVKA